MTQPKVWTFESYLLETILATRENPLYLPGAADSGIGARQQFLEEVLDGVGIAIIAVPSHVYRTVLEHMLPSVKPDMIFVSAAKGIENGSLMRMSEGRHGGCVFPETRIRPARFGGPGLPQSPARLSQLKSPQENQPPWWLRRLTKNS